MLGWRAKRMLGWQDGKWDEKPKTRNFKKFSFKIQIALIECADPVCFL